MEVTKLDIPKMQDIMNQHAYKEITVTQNFLNSYKAFHNSIFHMLDACPLIFKEYDILFKNYSNFVEAYHHDDDSDYHKRAGESLYTLSRYLEI